MSPELRCPPNYPGTPQPVEKSVNPKMDVRKDHLSKISFDKERNPKYPLLEILVGCFSAKIQAFKN